MSNFRINRIILTSLLLILIVICTEVSAQNYGTLDSRIYQNNSIINNSNRMNWINRESFKNKYLIDVGELNYKGLTINQYKEIENFANNTILEGNRSISNEQKLEKFYNFIVDNFYFYSTPEKISTLSSDRKYDNPYYLLTEEYNKYGKIRARKNGYASMMLALIRTQGMPSRIVGGYYNKDARDEDIIWGADVKKGTVNHVWVQVYVNGKWIMLDPMADSYKSYDDETLEYNDSLEEKNVLYFNPNVNILSKTHVTFATYSGIKNYKYVANGAERSKLISFLNNKSDGKTNGQRINSMYDASDSNTWFSPSGYSSKVNRSGYVTDIDWPSERGLVGTLNLNDFKELDNLSVRRNKITELSLRGASSLNTVNVCDNNMKKIVVKGSKTLELLKTTGNPSTYIEYNYGKAGRRVIVKAGNGGTVAVKYNKSKGKHYHTLMAKADSNHRFQGWYRGNTLVSKSATYKFKNSKSFTYTAKFIKKNTKTYIKVSISKQKLWYYKKGNLKYTSKVVTGMRRKHDTPRGTFTIQGKMRKVYLIGEDYKTYVNYWMPFNGPYGLHDATWRGYFGGTIYKNNGSHGCVNLPYKTAKYLYNHVSVGTVVKIVK